MPLVWLFHFFWVTFAFVQRNHLQHVIVVVDADRSIALAPQRFIIVTASTADVKIDLEEQAYGTVITIFVRLTRGCVPSTRSVTLRDVPALAITWVPLWFLEKHKPLQEQFSTAKMCKSKYSSKNFG